MFGNKVFQIPKASCISNTKLDIKPNWNEMGSAVFDRGKDRKVEVAIGSLIIWMLYGVWLENLFVGKAWTIHFMGKIDG